MKNRPQLLSSAGALMVLALVPAAARAHAQLDHADPKVGSSTDTAPTVVTLTFTESVEPDFTNVKVTDADGNSVDKGDTKVDPDDGKKVTVSLKDLPPGTYKVQWKVTSVDTHKTHGSFNFTVTAKK